MILCIETSTLNCSVALFQDGKCLASKEERGSGFVHGERLHILIDELLKEVGVKPDALTAVGVTKGPGSYTGLRIGVSAAKGLCFTLGIPMYSVTSTEVLASAVLESEKVTDNDRILALLDARRMEVYSNLFDSTGASVGEIAAEIVESNTFENREGDGVVWLCGDAQEKLMEVLSREPYRFTECVYPSARFMGPLIEDKITSGLAEDVAYFEPFYLKEFVAGTPRKSPLQS